MLRKLRTHFRQQFVGYIALFVALGGSAYAAATIGPSDIKNNAVRSRHIKDGAVKNPDLGANAVGTGKVIDGSLLKKDFKPGQLPKGDTGPHGPGALQFNTHVSEGGYYFSPIVKGVAARVYCDYSKTTLSLIVSSSGGVVGVSGLASADNTFQQITAQTDHQYDLRKDGVHSFHMDVLARNLDVNKWTHFVIGTFNARDGNGCGFWGVITPPSN